MSRVQEEISGDREVMSGHAMDDWNFYLYPNFGYKRGLHKIIQFIDVNYLP